MGRIKLLREFINSEKSGGLLLVLFTSISLILANSSFKNTYFSLLHFEFAGIGLEYVVNDGLMAIFFLLIGLELEREIYQGELSNLKSGLLPVVAAIGGMIVPALIYTVLNFGTPLLSGAGIPMATDIAFSLGILSLLGKRVPASLKIFLVALAVIDDLGAIIVIAVFYTKTLSAFHLLIACGIFGILLLFNRLHVKSLIPYLFGGVLMWYFILHSGVHATIAGVLLAFAIPFRDGGQNSPSFILQHILHKPVAFIILPVFALVNTAIVIDSGWQNGLMQSYSLGIMAGLVFGKPVGITFFTFLSVKTGMCFLPIDIKWRHIVGVGCIAGIGFTMSIFITLLSFNVDILVNNAKMSILLGSLFSGIVGFIWLHISFKRK